MGIILTLIQCSEKEQDPQPVPPTKTPVIIKNTMEFAKEVHFTISTERVASAGYVYAYSNVDSFFYRNPNYLKSDTMFINNIDDDIINIRRRQFIDSGRYDKIELTIINKFKQPQGDTRLILNKFYITAMFKYNDYRKNFFVNKIVNKADTMKVVFYTTKKELYK